MLTLTVDKSQIKNMMGILLKGGAFDALELRKAVVRSFADVVFEGEIFGEPDEMGVRPALPIALWRDVRPHIFGIVKAGATPRALKLVLAFPKDMVSGLNESVSSVFLNISFEGGAARITVGHSSAAFTLDKTIDTQIAAFAEEFIAGTGIVCSRA